MSHCVWPLRCLCICAAFPYVLCACASVCVCVCFLSRVAFKYGKNAWGAESTPHTIPPMSKCILTHSTFSVCVYCSVVLRLLLSLPICRVLVLITEEVRYMEYRRHILFFPTITCGFPPIPKYKVDWHEAREKIPSGRCILNFVFGDRGDMWWLGRIKCVYRYNGTVHNKDFQIGSMDVHALIHPQHTPPSHTTLHYTAWLTHIGLVLTQCEGRRYIHSHH